jgi:hypothetical protein
LDTINPEGIIKINNNLCIVSDEIHYSLVYINCTNGKILYRYLPTNSKYLKNIKLDLSYPVIKILPYQKNPQPNKGIEAIAYINTYNKLFYMYQSVSMDSDKILFVEIDLNKKYLIKNINTYDYKIDEYVYKKKINNFKTNDIKNVKISSMSSYNNNLYVAEVYKNILNIYRLNKKDSNLDKKLIFNYSFINEEKIEGFVIDNKYFYLGLDTDFLSFDYNLIKIEHNLFL